MKFVLAGNVFQMKTLSVAFSMVFLFVVNSFSTHSQLKMDNARSPFSLQDNNSNKMSLNVYLSRLLNLRYTGLEMGFEIKNNRWLSTEIRATQLFSKRLKDINSQWSPKVTGNIVQIEERFNLRGKAINGPYFAIGISQLWSNYKEEYWFNYEEKLENNVNYKVHYLDTITIQKR